MITQQSRNELYTSAKSTSFSQRFRLRSTKHSSENTFHSIIYAYYDRFGRFPPVESFRFFVRETITFVKSYEDAAKTATRRATVCGYIKNFWNRNFTHYKNTRSIEPKVFYFRFALCMLRRVNIFMAFRNEMCTRLRSFRNCHVHLNGPISM